MFASPEAQRFATQIRFFWGDVYYEIWKAFRDSAVGTGTEVSFFRKLLSEMADRASTLSLPGMHISCRSHEVHQKPRVRVPSRNFECELGDLLVVVKYWLPNGTFEAKSILYQVKMCKAGKRTADIDQNQLTLLTEWPEFYFGKTVKGAPQSFKLRPLEVEFSSYMIAQRAPAENEYLTPRGPYPIYSLWFGPVYGIAPTALRVLLEGSKTIDLDQFSEPCADVCTMVRHLMFELGEHHDHNLEARDLINALYRFVGWAPDPPEEFDDSFHETREEEIGFGVLEITVKFTGEMVKPRR